MTRPTLRIIFLTAWIGLMPVFAGAQVTTKSPPPRCDCTSFKVASPLEAVKAGEVVEFEVVADDPRVLKRSFAWTVSAGTIISGQGTTKIRVETTAEVISTPTRSATPEGFIGLPHPAGISLTATAEYSDDNACICEIDASETIRVGRQTLEKNKFADVTDLQLSFDQVVLGCQPRFKPREGTRSPTPTVIDVSTSAFDPENDVVTYSYTVSGGRIIGTGAKVKWDLTDLQPGTYTITGGVDDGCGICGKTRSQTVTITENDCSCGLVECPTIDVSGPRSIKRGTVASFTAHVSGGSQQSVTYTWTVENGEIIGGLGTPSIRVRIAKNIDAGTGRGSVSVTLKIGGLDPDGMCMDSVTREFLEEERRPLDR